MHNKLKPKVLTFVYSSTYVIRAVYKFVGYTIMLFYLFIFSGGVCATSDMCPKLCCQYFIKVNRTKYRCKLIIILSIQHYFNISFHNIFRGTVGNYCQWPYLVFHQCIYVWILYQNFFPRQTSLNKCLQLTWFHTCLYSTHYQNLWVLHALQ